MRARCYNPKSDSYRLYGQRGIGVCERWRDSFAAFLADMGERPDGMTLDRVDSDADYSPENCRWATPLDQARNKRRTRRLTYQGQTKCLTEWAELHGLNFFTLLKRLRLGWSPEAALTTKPRKRA